MYIARVNAESQNYRYESILTMVGIIDPNEICIAMIDGNLSILVQSLALLFFKQRKNTKVRLKNNKQFKDLDRKIHMRNAIHGNIYDGRCLTV